MQGRGPALLEEFTLVLSRQVQAIRQAMRDVTTDRLADKAKVKDFDERAASAAIACLRGLLESSDGDAGDAFLAVKDILAGTLERSCRDVLSTAISEFDFEEALLRLDEVDEIYGNEANLTPQPIRRARWASQGHSSAQTLRNVEFGEQPILTQQRS